MRPENFVAFFTVCGFFIGLMFTIVNIEDAVEIVVYTCLITFVFYVLIHIVIMIFVDVHKISGRSFNKEKYENENNSFIAELAAREKKMDYLLEKLQEEREDVKKAEGSVKRKVKHAAA
ncbi:putative membrane protein [Campylobacter subantarcticus LMG 24377]|uniref:Motility integral membrane protein n=2 Tax=Campylobacter subantarcticus TaxID=497724 RepID=A0ABW9N7A1_9BACT|nr:MULTISPECIES: hypothetical protein [Campylobacter]EAJ1261302.1 hypothetical protein [Campylobacter lari]AJC90141.1 putative membrane protein [Campylobacter subantarcticus LMG 24374]AJC91807.1 putative membrane protein [Campylobacter subantarcticus LMG 24377]EAL3939256.1 hypothetical protein [Campylobacter lari]MPC00137.1 hypothetical protein [Campylobacter subantarcticus]